MPASVTLGGFDTSRFVDHGEDFTITKEDTLLRTLVRGIQVSANGSQKAPEDWDSDILELSSWDKAFTALIDTSTPFMWLPDNVCEEFASALGLDYRDDLELYTISNDRYRDYRHTDSYTFTFSLSSTDNNDDLGDPLGTKGVVNITMPIQTFVSTVEYPFHDEAISYGAAAIPYFSLRKSGDNSTFVIGRSFLQETYLVTQYDKGTFSLHQALFPDDPERDANLVAIEQPSDSPYPAPPPPPKDGLSKGQIVGIVIGGSAAVLLCIIGWWYFRRRKAAKAEGVPGVVSESELDKASDASLKPRVSVKGSPLGRIITKIVGPKRSAVRSENRQREEQTQPFEAPNHHEIYEMPAPPPPVELNGDTSDEIDDVEAANAMMGLGGQYMSTYEQARLRIDRQLAGPVPEYSPPADGVAPPLEKAAYNYEQPRAIPAVDIQPVSPPATDSNFSNNSNSLQGSMGSVVSPVSATGNGTMRWDEPSPVAMIPPQLPSLGFSSQRRSDPSLDVSSQLPLDGSTSQSGDPHPPSSPVQRRAIDPSNVVCLGPLPENVQLPDHMALPQIMGPDGTRISPPSGSESRDPYEDTLGSNYTEEESRLEELATQASQYGQYQQYQHQQGTRWPLQTQDLQRGQYSSNRSHDPDTPESFERIDGMEFIHVPQPAEKRYSWEEDR